LPPRDGLPFKMIDNAQPARRLKRYRRTAQPPDSSSAQQQERILPMATKKQIARVFDS